MVEKITTQNFQTKVLDSKLPFIIDFYADWCGPCQVMVPTVDALANEYAGRVAFGKCNIDEEMDLADRFKVMSIPTFAVFKCGEHLETIIGSQTKSALAAKADSLI